jgi:hypothetical protein
MMVSTLRNALAQLRLAARAIDDTGIAALNREATEYSHLIDNCENIHS